MQESIMRYSGIYEEMEVFNNEFYVEPSPDSEEPSRNKKCQTFIRNPLYVIWSQLIF